MFHFSWTHNLVIICNVWLILIYIFIKEEQQNLNSTISLSFPTSPADVCSKQFKFMSLNLINLTFQNLLKDYEFYIEKQTLSGFVWCNFLKSTNSANWKGSKLQYYDGTCMKIFVLP